MKTTKFGEGRFIGVCRPNPDKLPDIPLPIYPRSSGHFIWHTGERENISGTRKMLVQIFWCIRGKGEFLVDNKWVQMKACDVFYRLPGENHICRCIEEPWEYRWVTFDGDQAAALMQSYGYPHSCFHAGACPEGIFKEFELLMQLMTPYSWRKMVICILDIIAQMGGVIEVTKNSHDAISQIIQICQKNFYNADFNVNVLADKIGMHRSTLRKLFKAKMHQTPSEYIKNLRHQHALKLLRSSSLPLREIASMSGFLDLGYFCRAIKKAYGTTAASLRRQSESQLTNNFGDTLFITTGEK